ncbi:secondary thiamine-phosphate synthase enzyme YjbQ [Segnochrobactrum spirostomi]|uniref:secondary thiamine-phosphate synthase enzyme YjbQ n=1 Tax=Segnochrobactrum spirostomi TaxID=2608987 RepID=UPI001AD7EFD5|nr:secondary thiamine-phosphate synthase enzyme YjbQ [Segnochrobactrum spirostomi]
MAQILSDPPVIKTVYGPASDLRQAIARMEVQTTGRGMVDITAPIDRWLASIKAVEGLLTLLLRHTSASLTIQENSDGNARADLMDAYDRLVPEGQTWRHSLEGPDDMPAHVKSALTGVHLSVPVVHGRVDLGTWQGLYVFEHRTAAHRRGVTLHYIGS